MMYPKSQQTKKTQKPNDKKMPKAEYKKKCDWLFDKYPVCPYCSARNSNQIHHTEYGKFGADRNDYSITPICDTCHFDIHHGKKHTENNRFKYIEIGKQMHKDWESENYTD